MEIINKEIKEAIFVFGYYELFWRELIRQSKISKSRVVRALASSRIEFLKSCKFQMEKQDGIEQFINTEVYEYIKKIESEQEPDLSILVITTPDKELQ